MANESWSSSPPSRITSLIIYNDVNGIIVPKAVSSNRLLLALYCETMINQNTWGDNDYAFKILAKRAERNFSMAIRGINNDQAKSGLTFCVSCVPIQVGLLYPSRVSTYYLIVSQQPAMSWDPFGLL